MLVRVCLLAALAISVDSFSYYPIFAGHSRAHARTQRVARTCSSGMRVLPRMAYSMSGAGGGHVEDKIETKENVLRKYVGRVWKVFEAAEWENMKRIGTENEAILCAEFRAAHCRKVRVRYVSIMFLHNVSACTGVREMMCVSGRFEETSML